MSSLSTSGPRSGALDLSQHLRRTAATYARASVRCRRRVIVEFSRRVFESSPVKAQLIDQETTLLGNRLVVADRVQWCCDY